jgi:hypothetical protein
MEQAAILSIIRTETTYRFRFDLPDGPVGQEHSTELTGELRERLRRALQAANQSMQPAAATDFKRQNVRVAPANDAVMALGRLLFESVLPAPIQDTLHLLESGALIIHTNTPDIPWELMVDSRTKRRLQLCQILSVGRTLMRENAPRNPYSERTGAMRKVGKRDNTGLSVLFMVNPTGERTAAEEEVASLCTSLPEAVTRVILYRQQANQLEMRMRMNSDIPHVLHYAGPLPQVGTNGEPLLLLAGNSRLDQSSLEQLFQGLPKHPLVFLSYLVAER